jgi:hypothetical protein
MVISSALCTQLSVLGLLHWRPSYWWCSPRVASTSPTLIIATALKDYLKPVKTFKRYERWSGSAIKFESFLSCILKVVSLISYWFWWCEGPCSKQSLVIRDLPGKKVSSFSTLFDICTNVTPIIQTHNILTPHNRTHKNPLKPLKVLLWWVRLPASNIWKIIMGNLLDNFPEIDAIMGTFFMGLLITF